MIYIGVTGKPGAGKTSFTEFWSYKSNVGVIHFDELVDNAKIKYFRPFMSKTHDNKPTKVNPRLKRIIYSNRIAFKILMFVRDRITAKEFECKIESFKRQGKDIIVIDDWMLNSHRDLYVKCSSVYVITRNFIDRRNGIMSRDNLSLQEVNVKDIPFALKYAKIPDGEDVKIIKNDGTLDELRKRMEQEYLEIGVMGFDEKYQIRDEGVKEKLRLVSRGATSVNSMLKKSRKLSREKIDN